MRYLLHQSIAEAAERDPGHEAIRFAADSLSYGELERRANGLARLLVDRGVRRGHRVGIYAEKCLELPVAMYGIMKAGRRTFRSIRRPPRPGCGESWPIARSRS